MKALLISVLLLAAIGSSAYYAFGLSVEDDSFTGAVCSDGRFYTAGCPDSTALATDGSIIYACSGGSGGNYIEPDGDNGNDGTTMDTAVLTLAQAKVLASASVGTDIRLCEGGLWQAQKLIVDWAGTTSDPVIIGGYRAEGSDAVALNTDNLCGGRFEQACSIGGEKRPEIRGELVDGCWDTVPPSCDYSDSAFTGYAINSLNDAYLVPQNDYQHFIALHLSNSPGRIITAKGVADADADDTYLTGLRVYSNLWENSGWNAVFENRVYNLVVRDTEMARWALCEAQEQAGGSNLPSGGSGNCGSSGAPGGLMVTRSPDSQALLENNIIGPGWGEAINCLDSSNMWIIGNYVTSTRSGGIYLDSCTESVVEQNISTNDPDGDNTCGTVSTTGCNVGTSTNFNTENTAANSPIGPHVVRNNILIGTGSRCFNVAMGSNSLSAGEAISLEFYGNTCIAPATNFMPAMWRTVHHDQYNWVVMESKSSYSYTEDETNYCDRWPSGTDGGFEYNGWPGVPVDADCYDSATDTLTGSLPSGFAPYATFKDYDFDRSVGDIVNDVSPTAAITTQGDPQLDDEAHDLDFDATFIQALWDESTLRCGTKAQWNKKLAFYRDCTERSTTAPGLGAVVPQ